MWTPVQVLFISYLVLGSVYANSVPEKAAVLREVEEAYMYSNNSAIESDSRVQTYNLGTCFLLRMKVHLNPFRKEPVFFENGRVNEAESDCGSLIFAPNLKIEFDQGSIYIMVFFDSNKAAHVLEISGTFKVNKEVFHFKTHPGIYFDAKKYGNYYKCDSEQKIPMRNGGEIVLSNFAYEVLRESSELNFYQNPEVCSQDREKMAMETSGLESFLLPPCRR